MYILGISCYFHDSAACLIKDGKVIAAAEEERFTRVKHDFSFPHNAIQFCLGYGKASGKDLDFVVFPYSRDKRWIKANIAEFLGIPQEKILFCEPHLSYAASAFFCSPYKKAAILTCDGAGERITTALGFAEADGYGKSKNQIHLFKEINSPHSLGLLYSALTSFLGFEVNEGEYKVMGMSSFGEPKYVDRIYKLIDVKDDGSFKLNMEYFSYRYNTEFSFNKRFEKLFGKSRDSKARFVTSKTPLYDYVKLPSKEELRTNQYYADVAASIQKVTEDTLIKIVKCLYQKTQLNKLCFSGGVALNCVANYRILKETPFDEIFIQPSAGDAGEAMGAALYVYYCLFGKKRAFIMRHAYWGKEYTDNEIETFLKKNNIKYTHVKHEGKLLDLVVKALISQKVVGWFQGRFEWGPRALGNRSILADPREEKMRDTVNIKIKYREPFRPFAPSVLSEKAGDFFDLSECNHQYPLRFMLYAIPVKEKELIPAVIHIDGSSRIQIVDKDTNPLFYRLIESFYQATGVPMLLNTSFNLKGEPIVNSPEDAFKTFSNSDMDMLVLENYILNKR